MFVYENAIRERMDGAWEVGDRMGVRGGLAWRQFRVLAS